LPLDISLEGDLGFEVLLVFSFTFFDIEVLKWYKSKGVKIIVFPIFDRTKSMFSYKLIKPFWNTIVGKSSIHNIRRQVLEVADFVVCANQSEQNELAIIYDLDKTKSQILYQGLSEDFFELEKKVDKDLFQKELVKGKDGVFGQDFTKQLGFLNDFVFCPAMSINKRKNQISLLKAISGTNIHLVLNNTDRIEDGLEQEFSKFTQNNPNIICLKTLDKKILASIYKSARICISVSNSETAVSGECTSFCKSN
jgi:hypothetical protein